MKQEIKDNSISKELFTGGDWQISKDGNDIEANFGGTDITGICTMYAYEKADADQALLVQAKNMYYALQHVVERITTVRPNDAFCLALKDICKEQLQKANPY